MTEKAIASGISASPTTSPARTSVLSLRGDFKVPHTDCSCSGVRAGEGSAVLMAIAGSIRGQEEHSQRLRV